jgi:hypothetical protein
MTPNRRSPAYALFAQALLPCGAANSASENLWKGSAKSGSRRLRNYHANHAIFLRVMIHLKVLKVLKVHLFPRRPGISQAAKQPPPTRGDGNFPMEGNPIRSGHLAWRATCST